MSDMMAKALEVLEAKVGETGFDGSVKFDIEGHGVIRIEDGAVVTEDGESDVTISATPDVLQELLEGELAPTAAFMSGKIKIDGDMGVAMKMSQLLG
ncbi:MAG: SCP2 sterol-binding domain-containing protein [Pseudomonadota bacterium]